MRIKTVITAIILSLIAVPSFAGSIQLTDHNGDSWVTGTSGGDGTFETKYDLDTLPDSFPRNGPIPNPERAKKAWKYVDGTVTYDTTGTNVVPSPSEAFKNINEYFINAEGGTDAGLNRVDSLLSNYPSADRAIDNNNFNIAKNRIDKANVDTELSDTEATDIKNILEGK